MPGPSIGLYPFHWTISLPLGYTYSCARALASRLPLRLRRRLPVANLRDRER